jgi:hypothetical protein
MDPITLIAITVIAAPFGWIAGTRIGEKDNRRAGL